MDLTYCPYLWTDDFDSNCTHPNVRAAVLTYLETASVPEAVEASALDERYVRYALYYYLRIKETR
jgi:hypothetical protein